MDLTATLNSDNAEMTGEPEKVDDESLIVQRARRGDTTAFEQLYRQNVGRVYALCMRMCGNPADAEELTQVVFIRAWEKLWTFRGTSAFSTWLHRLAVNVVLSERRSKTRRESRMMLTDDLTKFERPGPTSSNGARLDLESALAKLPEGARTVFVLHDIEGYRHREIGKLMGVTDGASKAQLHRARKLLRKALEP